MKNPDECPNCGYIFTAEDEEPDYISEVDGGGYESAKKPVSRPARVCPVCGEKCVRHKPKPRIREGQEDMEID